MTAMFRVVGGHPAGASPLGRVPLRSGPGWRLPSRRGLVRVPGAGLFAARPYSHVRICRAGKRPGGLQSVRGSCKEATARRGTVPGQRQAPALYSLEAGSHVLNSYIKAGVLHRLAVAHPDGVDAV